MSAWRISFVWEYDLEPVLKSRALGRFMDSFAHTFTFNTQHDTTPLSGLENWNDAARLLHDVLW
jgi:hypothetical protein